MACVSFWCQCRLAEVCVDSTFDPSQHATRECLRLGGSTASRVKFGGFRAPYIKTSLPGQDIIWTDSACPCSAEWAFRNHLQINNNIPNTAALFAFEDKVGKPIPMPQTWFMERCNNMWALSGLPSVTGHSFRIGGTTHLLLIGVDPFVVMVQGCWKSSAFLEYWQNCKEIIPTMIGLSLNTHSSILTSMTSFKRHLLVHC